MQIKPQIIFVVFAYKAADAEGLRGSLYLPDGLFSDKSFIICFKPAIYHTILPTSLQSTCYVYTAFNKAVVPQLSLHLELLPSHLKSKTRKI